MPTRSWSIRASRRGYSRRWVRRSSDASPQLIKSRRRRSARGYMDEVLSNWYLFPTSILIATIAMATGTRED